MTHARTHARTHAHGANYNLPPASRAGDNNNLDKFLIHILLDKLKIKNDLTRNILRGKPIPRPWD